MTIRLLLALLAGLTYWVPLSAVAAPEGWTLSLGWSPQYCKDHPGSKEPECVSEIYFQVHGLRPVFRGTPPQCGSGDLPDDVAASALLEIPNRARVRQIWNKEGACSGLDAKEYIIQLGRAARRFVVPPEFASVNTEPKMTQTLMRQAFIRHNRELLPGSMVMQCSRRYLSELNICLNAAFQPVQCTIGGNCREEFRVRPILLKRLRSN